MKKQTILISLLAVLCIFSGCHREPKVPNENSGSVVAIENLTETGNINVGFGHDPFYLKDDTVYYFGSTLSECYIIYYEDGSQETLREAFRAGRATISDLDEFGISYSMRKATSTDYATWWNEENADDSK